jgi:RNA polymerase sigma-70 factor (ECF subfamily)
VYTRQVEARPATDAELVRRTLQGDTDAFRTLVERYQSIVLKTAYVITGSRADAEEAAQDAFVKAHRSLGRFRRDRELRPWLLTIVANEARNRRRSNRLRATAPLETVAEAAADDPSPDTLALDADRRRQLAAALARLSPADRDVLGYRFFLDLPEAEIAAVLGVRRGTVKSRLSRALDRLRRELG